MKTTIQLPDSLLRNLKSHAALRGTSMRSWLTDAVTEKLQRETTIETTESGWRKVFGRGNKSAVSEAQSVIDREFSAIDVGEWE